MSEDGRDAGNVWQMRTSCDRMVRQDDVALVQVALEVTRLEPDCEAHLFGGELRDEARSMASFSVMRWSNLAGLTEPK